MNFTNSLLHWYLQNKRDLPWRKTTDPYAIWLSEIILQQTRVAQGLPYFFAFIDAFPTVFDLAKSDEEQVLKLWQGLGYYSRARNMHKTAHFIVSEFNGKFPDNFNDLLKLKGIGNYTAAAIASFAFNEVVPVVDGNVFRILSRYLDIETDISSTGANKVFAALAYELMPTDNPGLFNQAIMEFGALQCVPKNPNCSICVFNTSCAALQKKKVNQLPIKTKKTKVRNRYFNYMVFVDQYNNTIINKRTEKGIWHNLYEFPVIETEKPDSAENIIDQIKTKYNNMEIKAVLVYDQAVLHKLTHQHLSITFYEVKVAKKISDGVQLDTLKSFPFPIVIFNFIEKYSP